MAVNSAEAGSGDRFYFVGGHLCLDFVNTRVASGGEAVELLNGIGDLVDWARLAGVITDAQSDELRWQWSRRRDADAMLERVKEFRETLLRMAERVAAGKSIPESSLGQINEFLARRVGRVVVERVKGGFEKKFAADIKEPADLLWPIADSASNLLCYGDLSLVRKCENPECVLYFHDTTKNHSRRWCSMSACGNRMKAAAFYKRKRKSG